MCLFSASTCFMNVRVIDDSLPLPGDRQARTEFGVQLRVRGGGASLPCLTAGSVVRLHRFLVSAARARGNLTRRSKTADTPKRQASGASQLQLKGPLQGRFFGDLFATRISSVRIWPPLSPGALEAEAALASGEKKKALLREALDAQQRPRLRCLSAQRAFGAVF